MMKIKNLSIDNLAPFNEVNVSFDDNVTYLIGNNGDGKSTIGLNAIWFMFTGIVEKSSTGKEMIGNRFRFIGNKEAFVKGEMTLYDNNVEIKVIRRMSADANEVKFIAPEGYKLNQKWLTDLFNVFLIAPKKFIDLNPKEQALSLGIDTSEYDKKLATLKQEYTFINRDLKSVSNIEEVEPVEYIDSSELNKELSAIYEFNNAQDSIEHNRAIAQEKLNSLLRELEELNQRINKGREYIKSLPESKPKIDIEAINQKVKSVEDNNRAYDKYFKYLDAKSLMERTKKALDNNKKQQEEVINQKNAYLKSFKLPSDDMGIDDEGNLTLKGRFIKEPYFSSGELLSIVPVIFASLNPELKYVFIQQFNLLDEVNQKKVITYLTSKGFQLVIEYVSDKEIPGENCIILKDVTKA